MQNQTENVFSEIKTEHTPQGVDKQPKVANVSDADWFSGLFKNLREAKWVNFDSSLSAETYPLNEGMIRTQE